MNVRRVTKLITTGMILFPVVVFAQPENFGGVVDILLEILRALVPIIFGVTTIAILWAGSQMILHADNEQKRSDGKRTLLWGVIVLFIMISMWGLVNLISNSILF